MNYFKSCGLEIRPTCYEDWQKLYKALQIQVKSEKMYQQSARGREDVLLKDDMDKMGFLFNPAPLAGTMLHIFHTEQTSTEKEQASFPTKQELASVPTKQEQASVPTKQKQASVPTKQEQASVPTKQEQASVPIKQEQASVPTKQEQASVPTKQEQALLITEQEQTSFHATQAKVSSPSEMNTTFHTQKKQIVIHRSLTFRRRKGHKTP
jgi:hypothetical protein